MLNIGVIGYGYWGPNVVRNFHAVDQCCVKRVCDVNSKSLNRTRKSFPSVELTSNCDDILTAADIDAVAVVTPVATHFPLAKKAMENGKHVFVEKPFAQTAAQAQELIELATKKNLKIMVDHTFLFTAAVRKIKELIDSNVLGTIYYYDSIRVNLGLFQSDVNVIWDLAPHDLAIMQHLIAHKPQALVATGQNHVNGKEDVAYITLYFPERIIAHFNVNWLSPVKVRTALIGGEKKMIVWNDLEADEKIRVYNKGVERTNGGGLHDLLVSYRMGDIWAPRLEQTEALKAEAQYFVDCIRNDETPFNDGVAGLQVVRMLEAADASLAKRGGMIYL